RLGVQGVPLNAPDVLPSLHTGIIDSCAASPLALLALQWYTKVKYMTSVPTSIIVGANVLLKKDFDLLSAEDRKKMFDDSRELQKRSLEIVRKDNDRSLARLKQLGVNMVDTPPELVQEMHTAGLGVWDDMVDKLYSKTWLERIKTLLAEYRKAHP